MKCDETSTYVLCDYVATMSCTYARALPSDIQNSLKQRLPERILTSQGLYCNDISYLLREFKFSPTIYAASDNKGYVGDIKPSGEVMTVKIGLVCEEIDVCKNQDESLDRWDDKHKAAPTLLFLGGFK